MTKMTKAYVVFIIAASFYLYEYALQVSPSVMADTIMSSFHVDAAGLGTISAFYFYAYAPMQIPAGILYDRYGPRLLITMAVCICVAGTVFYAATTSVAMAALGRFMIGVGSAFSFVGIIVLISRWFPVKNFAMMAGIAQFMSSVGAICGEFPLAKLAEQCGWRHAMIMLALAGIFLALLVWYFVRDYPDDYVARKSDARNHALNLKKELSRLGEVLKQSQTWLIGTYAFAVWTPIAVFGSLWGVPFLCSLYKVDKVNAASACGLIWLGVGIGSALLGLMSDKMTNRRPAMCLSAIIGLIATIIMLYYPISWHTMYFFLFAFGFAAGGQAVSFALVQQNNKLENVGTASGFNNMAVLIGGAIFQQAVGYVLKFNWGHVMVNHVPIYSPVAYEKALIIMPICYAVALISIFLFIKITAIITIIP